MRDFRSIIKSIGGVINRKRYLGLLPGNLPVSAQNWGSSEFLKALEISLYTNKAIQKRADKVGEVEFQLKDPKDKDVENNPLLELLKKPNKVLTGRQFWGLYQKYLDAVGEAYILLQSEREIFEAKKIGGLHLLIPTLVTPHFDKWGEPTHFIYKTANEEIEYKAEQIIYIYNPNPVSPLRGQSLLKAGVNAIQTETQISTYHSRILENGGKVEGVFKFKTGMLTEDQLKETKERYQKEYGSAKKAGLPLFLGGDADYIKTGLSPEELSFLEAKKMTLEDICILTGVPKSMLASTNDAKFDNAEADRSIFLRETIAPQLKTLADALDKVLFPDEHTLTFIDPTPENVDRKLKENETGIKNYYMTPNEARERSGLDPIDGGDDILVPFNMMPLGDAGASLDAGEKAKARKKMIDLMLKESGENKAIEHPLHDADIREVYGRMQVKRMDSREKGFKKKLSAYFSGQEDRIIEQLQPKKTRKFKKKGLVDEVMRIDLEVKIGTEDFFPLLTSLLEQAGIDALELTSSEYAFNLTDDIKTWLESRTDIFLTKINETTFNKLKSEFEISLASDETREDLIKRIQETYRGINKSRAGLIARTEVHNATQYGTIQGYKQGGLTTKIWVAVLDGHTRDSHARVDGQERPLDRVFSNGLMFPGDPNGPAEEVINCRCVV